MVETLQPTREAENGSACFHSCQPPPRGNIKGLQRCNACRAVKYCGRKCQTADWKKHHKPVCKILRAFRKYCQDNPAPPRSRMLAVGSKFDTFKRLATSNRLTGADLPKNAGPVHWTIATQVVRTAPFCNVCHKNDWEHGATVEWTSCPTCGHGWACAEHSEEYLRTRHTKEICDTHVASANICRFRYNHTVKNGDHFMFVPTTGVLSTPLRRFPSDWDSWFKARAAGEYSLKHRLPPEFFPSGTFLLSQVNTIIMGMYLHDEKHFTSREELTIHVAGANTTFELEGGSPTCVWEEIMHVLPRVKRMNVFLVGPETGVSHPLTQVQACPDCVTKGRVRLQCCQQTTYHEFRASEHFVTPDFIAAFNTGMFEECTESWKESLNVMLELNAPCIFTSYNLLEAQADEKVLEQVGAKLTRAAELNPFRVQIPKVDYSEDCEAFFYDNMYYTCFKGRK